MKVIMYSILGLSIIAFDSVILKAAELNTATSEDSCIILDISNAQT